MGAANQSPGISSGLAPKNSYGTHVAHLQTPSELNTKKTKTHIPNLPKTKWLFGSGINGRHASIF
jgi:hypothetical protein